LRLYEGEIRGQIYLVFSRKCHLGRGWNFQKPNVVNLKLESISLMSRVEN